MGGGGAIAIERKAMVRCEHGVKTLARDGYLALFVHGTGSRVLIFGNWKTRCLVRKVVHDAVESG